MGDRHGIEDKMDFYSDQCQFHKGTSTPSANKILEASRQKILTDFDALMKDFHEHLDRC